jgi:hypothetical protein
MRPVAVRLAGDSAFEIAVAGKPDCYGLAEGSEKVISSPAQT